MIPIEPEPGNAGAGNRNFKREFRLRRSSFFYCYLKNLMAKLNWQIGCSGFYYKEWKGIFYPESLPQKEWFKFYAENFNTLELNVTFYRFPVLKSLETWYNTTPGNFSFAVKAPRLITHYKKFTDCTRLIDDFYTLVSRGLREKLGPILFQLPPKYSFTVERLELITKSMYKEFKNVLEFRDASWWIPQVFDHSQKEKFIFCGIDYPGLPNEAIITNQTVYYRFHGRPRLYYSAYKKDELNIIADNLLANKKITDAYIFFNNTATQAAIKNATWLKKYISSYIG